MLALPALLLATSCSALSGSSSDSSSGSGSNPNGLEKTTINVAIMKIADCAPVELAIKNGYFAAEGLTVKPVIVASGSVGIPKLEAGSVDISISNWATALEAIASKKPLSVVGNAAVGQAGTMALDALPSAGINSPQDLVGKTVSVNAFSDLPYMALKANLIADNVDVSKINFTIVAHPETPQALASGSVQASVQLEPYKTESARQNGARPVVDLFGSGPTASLPIAGYVAESSFVKKDPKTLAAFDRALAKGAVAAQNRATTEAIMPSYTGVDKTTADLESLPVFPTSVNATTLQRVADLMQQYGLLTNQLNVTPLIAPSALASSS
jgi:NitT/TauT family transport system substrate-binding protein